MDIADLATIEIAENGYPKNKKQASLVYYLRREISLKSPDQRWDSRVHAEVILTSMVRQKIGINRKKSEVPYTAQIRKKFIRFSEIMIDKLIEAGTLSVVQDGTKHGKIQFKIDLEPVGGRNVRLKNYHDTLRILAAKTVKKEKSIENLFNFLFQARQLYGFHLLQTTLGKAILFPELIGFDGARLTIERSIVIVNTTDGAKVYRGGQEAVTEITWHDGKPSLSLNCDHLTIDGIASDELNHTQLIPVGVGEIIFFKKISATMKKSLNMMAGKRETLSNFIGEEITPEAWRSFSTSFSNARRFSMRNLGFATSSILDKRLRKVALRKFKAEYADYNALFPAVDQTERLVQASDIFPVFTSWFMTSDIRSRIEAGEPLLPLIAHNFGLTIPQVRKMKGVHWQRMGLLAQRFTPESFRGFKFFAGVPPEKMPVTKAEWADCFRFEAVLSTSASFLCYLPTLEREKLGRVLCQDWNAAAKVLRLTKDMLDDFSALIASLIVRRFVPATLPIVPFDGMKLSRQKIRAKLFVDFFGPDFGLKKIQKMNHTWHKGVALRTRALSVLKREFSGIERSSWPKLAPDFSSDHGSLVFLTDEDQLIGEGLEMNHCVGTYIDDCVRGYSYIAAIKGKDGSRSTVEFSLFVKRDGSKSVIEIEQHQSYGNSPPTGDVQKVLDAFMKHHEKTEFKPLTGTSAEFWEENYAQAAPIPDEIVDRLAYIYRNCLDDNFFKKTAEEWKEIVPTLIEDPAMTEFTMSMSQQIDYVDI